MLLDVNGRPRFALIFEASHRDAKEAKERVPQIGRAVRVVGERRLDDLIVANSRRHELRQRMGFNQRPVIMIASTFGTESLRETLGPRLYEEALKLQGQFQFIASTHPRHWPPLDRSTPHRAKLLEELEGPGFRVHRPGQSFVDQLAVADMLITDFGSLGVQFAVLCRPIAFVPFPPTLVTPGSALAALKRIAPELGSPELLGEVVRSMQTCYPINEHRAIAKQLHDYPGHSLSRMAAELYDLLGIDPPSQACAQSEITLPSTTDANMK
jgi:CDP-glycerol glycerophosphotransferase (TagB/SpsB family)